MSSIPDFDPYAVLGVQKDATLAEIRTARKKLALIYHPDKIKDNSSTDQFQKIQQAFELLSDERERTKYDHQVRINELRREMAAHAATAGGTTPHTQRGSAVREYRDGRIYEERSPADVYDDVPFAKEPRPTSRKNDEFGMRQRTRASEEKKKTKSVPLSSPRPPKDTVPSSAKTTHTDRPKHRTKERRREANFEKMYSSYVESEDDASDSSLSSFCERVRRPSTRSREPSFWTRPTESSRRPERRYEEEYSDEWDKHEKLHSTAQNYIRRSGGTVPVERDPKQRPSRSPPRHRGNESADPESSSSRRTGRSKSSRESVRPDTSRHDLYENLEGYGHQSRSYETKVPPMPTAATSSGTKASSSVRPSVQPSRSATTSYSRSKREGSGRSDPVLRGMVYSDALPRTTKVRGVDKPDSGYSSPGTPDMTPGESPPKTTSTRYKVFNDKVEPETILVEPNMPSPSHPSLRHSRTSYIPSQERPARSPPKPVRSNTHTYISERYEHVRPENARQSSRQLFGEVKEKDIKYREINPEQTKHARHNYDSYAQPPVGRRQSAY